MEAPEHHRRAALEAVQVFARNPIVRWALVSLLAALVSVAGFAAEGELGKVNTSIAAQTAAVEGMQERFAGLETKIGEISEKLVRVEERYASHDGRIDDLVGHVGELRRRLDQMAVDRDLRLRRWEESMARHAEDQRIERAWRRKNR